MGWASAAFVHVQVQGLKIGLTFRICQHTVQHAFSDDAIFGFLSTEIRKQQQQPTTTTTKETKKQLKTTKGIKQPKKKNMASKQPQ